MLSQKFLRLPLWLWATFLLFIAGGFIAFTLSQPTQAGWRYGACKAFLEQYVRFPSTINIKIGGETRASAVIGFADINPFGAEQIRVFECYYSQDNQGRTVLSKVTMDRKALPEDTIQTYNAMLPILLSQKLDTALPDPLPDALEDLKN